VARHPKVKRGRKPSGFPSRVLVYGHAVEIIYCHEMPKGYVDTFGVTYHNEKRIYINLDQPRDEMERTVFHEICHMVLFLSGHKYAMEDGQEEAVIRALEHGLLPLYRRKR
jgi:Zn-dependent peptidase ImmA (M78 family)